MVAMEAFELLKYKGAKTLFETLQTSPNRQFSVNELAKVAGLPFTSVWKLVKKFEAAGVVETTLIGKSRAVRYNRNEFVKLLENVVRISRSQQRLSLRELKATLKNKKQVKSAYLFGSVAEGKEGLESDVDVAILVKKAFDIHPLISEMHEKYGVKLVPLTFQDKDEFYDFLDGKKKVLLA